MFMSWHDISPRSGHFENSNAPITELCGGPRPCPACVSATSQEHVYGIVAEQIQASQARAFEAFEELSKKLLQSEYGTGSTRLWVCFFKTLDVNIAWWDFTKDRLLSLCLIPPVGCEGVVALVGDHASLTGSPQRW